MRLYVSINDAEPDGRLNVEDESTVEQVESLLSFTGIKWLADDLQQETVLKSRVFKEVAQTFAGDGSSKRPYKACGTPAKGSWSSVVLPFITPHVHAVV